MPDRYPTTDAPVGTDRDDARHLGKGAIALLALGAPFVAVAPAAADGGGPGHGQAAAQTSASASTDASGGGGGQGAASAAGAPQSSAASAAAPAHASASAGASGGGTDVGASGNATAETGRDTGSGDTGHENAAKTGAPHSVETSDGGTAATTPSASAGGNAEVRGGAHTSGRRDGEVSGGAHAAGRGNSEVHGSAHTAGRGDSEVRGGAHAAGRGETRVGGGAKARGDVGATAHASANGRPHARAENGAMSARHGSGEAGAHARGDSRAQAGVHGAGEAQGQENRRGEGNGGAGASTHVGGRANKRHVGHRTVEGHGERGFTDVRVTPQHEGRAGGRTSAVVKASPALEAAIRAEAREAARAEIHARFARPEAAKRFAVKRRFESGQRLRTTADTHAEALLRMLETAWTTGGPARANALLELCLGRPATVVSSSDRRDHAARERQDRTEGRRGGNANGNAEDRGEVVRGARGEAGGEIVGGARGEDRGEIVGGARGEAGGEIVGGARGEAGGEIVGGARESGEGAGGDTRSPGAPVETPSSRPMPGVLPETTEAFQAPQEADRPQQPRGSATLPGATQPQGSTTGPGITTGASAPSGVRREASAAGLPRQLPFTGGELPLTIIAGATALAAGALLRRRVQGGAR